MANPRAEAKCDALAVSLDHLIWAPGVKGYFSWVRSFLSCNDLRRARKGTQIERSRGDLSPLSRAQTPQFCVLSTWHSLSLRHWARAHPRGRCDSVVRPSLERPSPRHVLQLDPMLIHSTVSSLPLDSPRSAGAASMSMSAHAIIASPHIRGRITAYHFAACTDDRAGGWDSSYMRQIGRTSSAMVADSHTSHPPNATRRPRRNRLNSSYHACAVTRG